MSKRNDAISMYVLDHFCDRIILKRGEISKDDPNVFATNGSHWLWRENTIGKNAFWTHTEALEGAIRRRHSRINEAEKKISEQEAAIKRLEKKLAKLKEGNDGR